MRLGFHSLRPWYLVIIGAALSFSVTTDLSARSPVLQIGRLSVSKAAHNPRLLPSFRTQMHRQVAKLPLRGRKTEAVISGRVVRMKTKRTGHVTKATCVVSATLARPKDGALIAILQGKATAEDSHDVATTEAKALEAAVHSTLQGVPKVLR